MTIRDFKIGFFGKNPFDKEASRQFQKKWSKIADNEKLDFANERKKSFP